MRQSLASSSTETHSLPGRIYNLLWRASGEEESWITRFPPCASVWPGWSVIPLGLWHLLHLSKHTRLKCPALSEVSLVASCVGWNLWPLAELASGPSKGSLLAHSPLGRCTSFPKLWSRRVAKQLELKKQKTKQTTKTQIHKIPANNVILSCGHLSLCALYVRCWLTCSETESMSEFLCLGLFLSSWSLNQSLIASSRPLIALKGWMHTMESRNSRNVSFVHAKHSQKFCAPSRKEHHEVLLLQSVVWLFDRICSGGWKLLTYFLQTFGWSNMTSQLVELGVPMLGSVSEWAPFPLASTNDGAYLDNEGHFSFVLLWGCEFDLCVRVPKEATVVLFSSLLPKWDSVPRYLWQSTKWPLHHGGLWDDWIELTDSKCYTISEKCPRITLGT